MLGVIVCVYVILIMLRCVCVIGCLLLVVLLCLGLCDFVFGFVLFCFVCRADVAMV